jgi:transcriptional regulator with XRE-family HTH domain
MYEVNYDKIIALFAGNLKQFREKNGITQEYLADISGVDRSYISRCESAQCNPSVDILVKLASALQTTLISFFEDSFITNLQSPRIDEGSFRNVPLPETLTQKQISDALQETHDFFSLIRYASRISLPSIIQGNNFSGIVSNVFTRKLSVKSSFKEFSEQRYPDLIGPTDIGLEVKASINAWKGGEGHNGHSGWHIIVCYHILENGDIEVTQVEIADLVGFGLEDSDWKYMGSKRNKNDSQRTETYITTNIGTAKLRDGSVYLRSDLVHFHKSMLKYRQKLSILPIPTFSPFFKSKINS